MWNDLDWYLDDIRALPPSHHITPIAIKCQVSPSKLLQFNIWIIANLMKAFMFMDANTEKFFWTKFLKIVKDEMIINKIYFHTWIHLRTVKRAGKHFIFLLWKKNLHISRNSNSRKNYIYITIS